MSCYSENIMVDNISILFSGMCVFLSITDMQIVQLQTVPNPCPDITTQSTIDMCTSDYATEENNNGGTTADSVALRVMTQQNGCECEVTLQNQSNIYTLRIRKYDLVTSAAPERIACGLAIDIDYNIPNNLPDTKDPIECTKGTDDRVITLSTNGILFFKSRIIAGTFSREHSPRNALRLQLHCSQYLTTPPVKNITTCIESVSENGNVRLPAIIAAVIGWCLTALFAVTTLCLYRRMNTKWPNISGEQNPQYDDLHAARLPSCYSSLNASAVNSEQHEHI